MKAHLVRGCVVAVLILGWAEAARAQDWKPVGTFGWFATGKVWELGKGHTYWLGEFSGTFLNDKGDGSLFHRAGVRCPAFDDNDSNTKKRTAAGRCIITDRDGDQAFLTWQGAGDSMSIPGTFSFIGGTGKYKGINSSNNFTGGPAVPYQDGTASGFSTWNR